MTPPAATFDAVAVGEALVAFVGSTVNVSLPDVATYGVHVVGAETNAAIGLARLGYRVALVGHTGTDPFGKMIRRRLVMEGIETRWMTEVARPTGLLFRNLRTGAPPEVVYRRDESAGSRLTVADAKAVLPQLAPNGYLLLSGVTSAVAPAETEAIAWATRRAGRKLCLDLNYRSRLWPRQDAARALRALVGAAQIVVGDNDEAAIVTGTNDVNAAGKALLDAGPDVVVLRHDVVAATWFATDLPQPITVRSTLLPALDAVGAGDAFLAGLISCLLDFGPEQPERCLHRAHTCAAAVVNTPGDSEGTLYRHELLALEDRRSTDPLR